MKQQQKSVKKDAKYEMNEEFFFYMDMLADDFCDQTSDGSYQLKEKYRDRLESSDINHDSSNNEATNESPTKIKQGPEDEKPESSAENKKKYSKGRWTEEEHMRFLEALRIYGKDWDLIEAHIGTRDAAHSRSHAQKFFTKLMKHLEKKDEKGQEQPIQNAELYYEILQRKVEKPNRKKGRAGHVDVEGHGEGSGTEAGPDEYDLGMMQGKIFAVQKDPEALQKQMAFKNTQPSELIQNDIQEIAYRQWR